MTDNKLSGWPNPDRPDPPQKIMLAIAAAGTVVLFGALFYLFVFME